MDVKAEFNRAVAAAKQKDFHTARTILRDLLKENPHYTDAWILFAHVAQTREQAIYCLERALFLEHDNKYVRQQLARLRAIGGTTQKPAPPVETQKPEPPKTGRQRIPAPKSGADGASRSRKTSEPKKRKIGTLEKALLGFLGVAVIVMIVLLSANTPQSREVPATETNEPTPSSNDYFQVINNNVRASNAEDINWYMSTIHPDNPEYEQIKQLALDSFTSYNLYVQVYDMEIVKETRTEVQVAFTMEKQKIRGANFQDHRIEGIFILRPDEGTWKIYNQKIEKIENLE